MWRSQSIVCDLFFVFNKALCNYILKRATCYAALCMNYELCPIKKKHSVYYVFDLIVLHLWGIHERPSSPLPRALFFRASISEWFQTRPQSMGRLIVLPGDVTQVNLMFTHNNLHIYLPCDRLLLWHPVSPNKQIHIYNRKQMQQWQVHIKMLLSDKYCTCRTWLIKCGINITCPCQVTLQTSLNKSSR